MYVGANIAPVGITAGIPKGPPRCTWSAWDGGSVGLEEVGLVERCGVAQTGEDGEAVETMCTYRLGIDFGS